MRQVIFIISLCLFWFTGFCQLDSSDLANWKKYRLPIKNARLDEYNHSPNDWEVYEFRNSAHAKKQNSYYINLPFKPTPSDLNEEIFFRCPKAILNVDDGYLVSFYRGEFGGYLYWFSLDGSHKIKISHTYIVQFIVKDKRFYAIDGLDHMGMNLGSIREIRKSDTGWSNTEYLELASSPYAILLDEHQDFIVVTSENIISIDRNKKIEILFAKGFWRVLYPTSMILNNGIIYVGMRAGVFKYNLKTRKKNWLMIN